VALIPKCTREPEKAGILVEWNCNQHCCCIQGAFSRSSASSVQVSSVVALTGFVRCAGKRLPNISTMHIDPGRRKFSRNAEERRGSFFGGGSLLSGARDRQRNMSSGKGATAIYKDRKGQNHQELRYPRRVHFHRSTSPLTAGSSSIMRLQRMLFNFIDGAASRESTSDIVIDDSRPCRLKACAIRAFTSRRRALGLVTSTVQWRMYLKYA